MATVKVTWTQYDGKMDLFADVPTHTEREMSGVLTNEHSASSYGLPVVVADDGQVFVPSECTGDLVVDFGGQDRLDDERADLAYSARTAGYRLSNM